MIKTRTIQLPEPRNVFYYFAGFAILFLNKIRHGLKGYQTPRTFPISEINQAVSYDLNVVNHWQAVFEEYTGKACDLTGRTILELGPGADLGIGLITLARGARKYNALDINNLVESVPDTFYSSLFDTMKESGIGDTLINVLQTQLNVTREGRNDRLNYVCRKDFNVTTFADEGIDTVFSQAAFEHFDDISHTFSQLSETVKSGTILIAEIDLNTHTRWIRDVDPLNIYRYSDFIYNLFHFPGSPNRLRPAEYVQILEQQGWQNIQIKPLVRVSENYLEKTRSSLAARFRQDKAEIEYLSVVICATKI